MRSSTKIGFLMSALPLIITLIVFVFLPDEIPVHWNSGVITEWGSKFSIGLFIIPLASLFVGILFTAFGIQRSKKSKENRNFWDNFSVYSTTTLLIIQLYILFLTVNGVDMVMPDVENVNLVPIIIGVIMIVLGAIMPFTKSNMYLGIRTKQSMNDENTWKTSQRFGGVLFIIGGIFVIVLAGLIMDGKWGPMAVTIMTVILIAALCMLQTYLASKYNAQT